MMSSFMRTPWMSPCITKSTFHLSCDAETGFCPGFPPIELSRDSALVGPSVLAWRKPPLIIQMVNLPPMQNIADKGYATPQGRLSSAARYRGMALPMSAGTSPCFPGKGLSHGTRFPATSKYLHPQYGCYFTSKGK